MSAEPTEASIRVLLDKVSDLRREIATVIVGQEQIVEELLIALFSRGHCLLEGLPGLGKTLLIKTIANCLSLTFNRIQFTPDLMPGDIIGTEVLEEDHATGRRFFQFNRGPLFGNLILADEINRTPPKTQAALLEAMQESAVTYSGKTYPLEQPFFVLATQNPIEQAGTYPLPEAQLDRFLLYLTIDYPSEAEEVGILRRTTVNNYPQIKAVMTGAEICELQTLVREVVISDDLLLHAARLVRATRQREHKVYGRWIRWGAGPRAAQALVITAKARALLSGRLAVTLADLQAMVLPVLQHRVLLTFQAETDQVPMAEVLGQIVASVPLPKSPLR